MVFGICHKQLIIQRANQSAETTQDQWAYRNNIKQPQGWLTGLWREIPYLKATALWKLEKIDSTDWSYHRKLAGDAKQHLLSKQGCAIPIPNHTCPHILAWAGTAEFVLKLYLQCILSTTKLSLWFHFHIGWKRSKWIVKINLVFKSYETGKH